MYLQPIKIQYIGNRKSIEVCTCSFNLRFLTISGIYSIFKKIFLILLLILLRNVDACISNMKLLSENIVLR